MMMTKILAMTYIMSKFTMVDDQQDDGYEDYDAEDYDQDHDPFYDYDQVLIMTMVVCEIDHLQDIDISKGQNWDDSNDSNDENDNDNYYGHMDHEGSLRS